MGSEKHPQTVWNRADSFASAWFSTDGEGEARKWLRPQAGCGETATTTSRGLIHCRKDSAFSLPVPKQTLEMLNWGRTGLN